MSRIIKISLQDTDSGKETSASISLDEVISMHDLHSLNMMTEILCQLNMELNQQLDESIELFNSEHSVINKCVTKIEGNIDEMRKDISYLKGSVDLLSKNPLAQAHSPISLTELGLKVSDELGAPDIIARNWAKIQNDLDLNICNKNAYDIQQYCMETAAIEPERFLSTDDLNKLKQFAFKQGNSLQYYAPVFGVIIRDKYFEIKGI